MVVTVWVPVTFVERPTCSVCVHLVCLSLFFENMPLHPLRPIAGRGPVCQARGARGGQRGRFGVGGRGRRRSHLRDGEGFACGCTGRTFWVLRQGILFVHFCSFFEIDGPFAETWASRSRPDPSSQKIAFVHHYPIRCHASTHAGEKALRKVDVDGGVVGAPLQEFPLQRVYEGMSKLCRGCRRLKSAACAVRSNPIPTHHHHHHPTPPPTPHHHPHARR